MDFIKGPLKKTLNNPTVWAVTNFNFLPFGNAYIHTAKCPGTSFSSQDYHCWYNECGGSSPPSDCFDAKNSICQHGPSECHGNLIDSCAMAVTNYNATNYMPFVECFEGTHDANSRWVSACARANNLDYGTLQRCIDGSQGLQVEGEMAKRTAAFGSSRKGTPWVVINGKYSEKASDNLTEAICNAFTGPRPSGCHRDDSVKIERHRLNHAPADTIKRHRIKK